MNNLMLDLETLGRKPGCGITEIGWCCFADNEYKVSASFGHLVPLEQSMLYGFDVDPATVKWWLETQRGFPALVPSMNYMTFPQILSDVAAQWNELWFAGVQRLWSKPSVFDIPILKAAFDRLNVERPIILREENFWRWRDMMTITDIESKEHKESAQLLKVAHRAKADAEAQARRVSSILSLQRSIVKDAMALPTAEKDVQMYNGMYLRERDALKQATQRLDKRRGRIRRTPKSRKR